MTKNFPKIMLLTGSPPGEKGVGQIIVNEICRHYPLERIACFATMSRHESWTPAPEFSDLAIQQVQKRFEHRYRPFPGPLGSASSVATYWGMFRRHCRSLTQQAIAFGRQHNCEILFSILESATNIQITDDIAKGLGIPKHVLVWDAPDFIATHLRQTPLNLSAVMKAFDNAMTGAAKVAVVSDPMARLYESQYGVETVMLRHAAPPAAVKRPSVLSASGPIVIGFAGSVSARPQLDLLQQSLDQMNWKINDRDVRLDLYGMRFVLESRKPRNVRYCGYRSVADTVQALSETADVLFMPQPFDKASASFTELSFPTKLSTYFASGRPILLLSPKVSSLGEFISEVPFGIWCSEMNQDQLGSALRTIVTDDELRQRSVDAIEQQRDTNFSPPHFAQQLHQFLGASREAISS